MDWLTFTAEVVKALAWPAAILFSIAILRKPLSGLIPLLQRLKYKDLELEFGKKIQELKADAAKALPVSVPEIAPSTSVSDSIIQLAEISPRASIVEAWRELESTAAEAASRHQVGLTPREVRSTAELANALERAKILDHNRLNLFHNLRALRNKAAHSPDFALDSSSALEYADLAGRLEQYLRTA